MLRAGQPDQALFITLVANDLDLLKKLEALNTPLTKEAPEFVNEDELESYAELYQLQFRANTGLDAVQN